MGAPGGEKGPQPAAHRWSRLSGGGGPPAQTTWVSWAGPRRASGEPEAAQKACPGEGRGLKLGAAGPTTDPREGDLLLPLCLPAPRMQAWRRGPRRAPCPGGAPGAAAFKTGRPLITPWLPEPRPRRAHAFSTSGQDGANPGTGASKMPRQPVQEEGRSPGGVQGPPPPDGTAGSGGGRRGGERHTPHGRDKVAGSLGPPSPSPPPPEELALAVGSPARGRGKNITKSHQFCRPTRAGLCSRLTPSSTSTRSSPIIAHRGQCTQLPPTPPQSLLPRKPQGAWIRCCSPLPTPFQGSHLPRGQSPRPPLTPQALHHLPHPLPVLPSSLILLQPRRPPYCSSNMPGTVLPQGLCTCCARCPHLISLG